MTMPEKRGTTGAHRPDYIREITNFPTLIKQPSLYYHHRNRVR
jgi:hypothetical protein